MVFLEKQEKENYIDKKLIYKSKNYYSLSFYYLVTIF